VSAADVAAFQRMLVVQRQLARLRAGHEYQCERLWDHFETASSPAERTRVLSEISEALGTYASNVRRILYEELGGGDRQ
jgi:heterodisulfide reductase subunit B